MVHVSTSGNIMGRSDRAALGCQSMVWGSGLLAVVLQSWHHGLAPLCSPHHVSKETRCHIFIHDGISVVLYWDKFGFMLGYCLDAFCMFKLCSH